MNRAARSLVLSATLGTLSAVAPSAFAQAAPPAMRLDYRREAGAEPACPDEQEFRDAMTAHVHRPLFDPAATSVLVVRLQGRNAWYRGVAELRDAAGAPVWTIPLGPVPRDCSAVVDSLALSVAIKVDPRGSRTATPALVPNNAPHLRGGRRSPPDAAPRRRRALPPGPTPSRPCPPRPSRTTASASARAAASP